MGEMAVQGTFVKSDAIGSRGASSGLVVRI